MYHASMFISLLATIAQYSMTDGLDNDYHMRHISAVISAALLYQGFPQNAPTQHGLWIDHSRKSLWLDGMEVTLAPGEFRLVEYLARTPGDICSFWSIISELFPSAEILETNSMHLKGYSEEEIQAKRQEIITSFRGTIDPIVFRIRNAAPNRLLYPYLRNERGVGLRLELAGER